MRKRNESKRTSQCKSFHHVCGGMLAPGTVVREHSSRYCASERVNGVTNLWKSSKGTQARTLPLYATRTNIRPCSLPLFGDPLAADFASAAFDALPAGSDLRLLASAAAF